MFRIRFHGRGGQGIKTAGRILGTAFFIAGFEVQDAPRYGAERRGAPIFAYVRASREPILERGIIRRPDLVILTEDSLFAVPAAGVLLDIAEHTVFLIATGQSAETWKHRLNLRGPVLTLPVPAEVDDRMELRFVGAECAGAATALSGAVSAVQLAQAVDEELASLKPEIRQINRQKALQAYQRMVPHRGLVQEGGTFGPEAAAAPDWVEPVAEPAVVSAPAIHRALTSELSNTGLWRTLRPVIDYDACSRCWWVCSSACPDGAISLSADGRPEIDYDHCKGCLVCLAQCPPHAIQAVAETTALAAEGGTS
jgi:pyruvate ferredoxin oxidoreductase gamma subunit